MDMELKGRKKFTWNKFFKSFGYACQGIAAAFKREVNMKIHSFIALVVIIGGMLLKISLLEWFICIIFIGLVIGAELLNTAIEATVDLVYEQEHPLAKLAKDTAAGAVLVLATAACVSGFIIFLPKLIARF